MIEIQIESWRLNIALIGTKFSCSLPYFYENYAKVNIN